MQIRCPHCQNGVELVDDSDFQSVDCPSCGSQFGLVDVAEDNIDTLRPGDDVPEGAERTGRQGSGMIAHFELVEEVGRGAFGSVWRARDTELDRTVAVKVPRPGQFSQSSREQFLREARAAAQLSHPNIVSIYEVGLDDDRVYIVSDFVEGVSLAELLSAHRLSPREAIRLCVKVTLALDHAHENGVIHRDLKPSNIMLGENNEPFVMDFGLAKREAGEITMTLDGKLLGTPAYMPPEQARGEGHHVDRRADVYSVGVILYELLTGELPFRGTTRMLLHQVMHEEAPSPKKLNNAIPRDLETICLKCLEKEPGKRYDTCAALAEDLEAWLDHKPIKARAVGRAGKLARWCKRKPAVAALSATVVLVLLAGTAISTYFAIDAAKETTLAQAAEKLSKENAEKATLAKEEEAEQRAKAQEEKEKAEQERERAKAETQKAVQARDDEAQQRVKAEDATRLAERQVYIADMRLALASWRQSNMELLRNLLDRHKSDTNLIGFEWPYLNRLAHSEITTIKHIGGHVDSISISAAGHHIASTGNGNTNIFDLANGQISPSVSMRGTGSGGVAISPDGKRVVTSGESDNRGFRDGSLIIFDAKTGQKIHILRGHTKSVMSVATSPDGRRFVSGSDDKTLKVWDWASGQELRTLHGHDSFVRSVAISPDGTWIVSGSEDKTIKIWDLASGQELQTLSGHDSSISSVAISPDGKWIVSGSRDKTIKTWDLSSGQELQTLRGHTDSVNSIAVSPDGERIVSASEDKTIKVWDSQKGRDLLFVEILTLKGHKHGVRSVAFIADGTRIASGSHDGTIKLWDFERGHEFHNLTKYQTSAETIAINPDAKTIVSAGYSGHIHVWDAKTGQERYVLKGHSDKVSSVAVSFDGKRIVSGSADKTLRIWDAISGQELQTLRGHDDRISSVAISPDGKRIVSGGSDETVKIWDLASGRELHTLDGHKYFVFSVAISPDGKRVVSVAGDIRIWDLETGQELPFFEDVYVGGIVCVTFSPDGKNIISGGQRGNIQSWDATTGKVRQSLTGHTSDVRSIAVSPDGKRIASGSQDKTIKIWDSKTLQELFTLHGHTSHVASIAFSPDGDYLLSGSVSPDNTIKIWDARPLELEEDLQK